MAPPFLTLTQSSGVASLAVSRYRAPANIPVRKTLMHAEVSEAGDARYSSLLDLLTKNPGDMSACTQDEAGNTPLLIAAERKNGKICMLLLEKAKVDVTQANHDGNTALHFAVRSWGSNSLSTQLRVLNLLFHHGANLEARNRLHETPLHSAVMRGEPAVVTWLVEHKAELEAPCALRSRAAERGHFDVRPLHAALLAGRLLPLLILLEAGADPTVSCETLGGPPVELERTVHGLKLKEELDMARAALDAAVRRRASRRLPTSDDVSMRMGTSVA